MLISEDSRLAPLSGSMNNKGLVIAISILMSVSSLSSVAADGQEESTIWGVSYDWSHFEGDSLNMTGVDVNEVNRDMKDAADYAGFSLDYDQVLTGTTQFFVESWDDSGDYTVTDVNGTSYPVSKRVTELTIRHGSLADTGIASNWSDGNEEIELWSSAYQDTLAVINANYVEFVDEDLVVYGAELQMDGELSISMGFDIEVDVLAANESLSPEISADASLSFSIPNLTSNWKVFDPVDYHFMLESEPTDESAGDAGADFSEDELAIGMDYEDAGHIEGSFSSLSSYSLELSASGVPTEEVDIDIDVFNIALSDNIQDEGVFFEEMTLFAGAMWGMDCPPIMGSETMVSEGSEIEVQCGLSPPIPWGMAMMMGISMFESFDSGVDQLFDVMSEQIEKWAEESGLSGDSDSDIFLCDNGNEIPADWENDGEDDCGDGSDETGSGSGDTFTCDNGDEIPADWENDGEDDCGDGSDETGPLATNKYEKMADALLDSNLNKTMEAFADKLERLVEDNIPSEPIYDLEDACGTMFWRTSDSRVVGMALVLEGRIILGPSINNVKDHPVSLNIEYLDGQSARDAKSGTTSIDEMDEMAPASKHNVEELYRILGPKYIPELDTKDTDGDGTIDFFDSDDDNDGVSDWEDPEPTEATGEDSAVPSPGLVAVLSILASAAILSSRREN